MQQTDQAQPDTVPQVAVEAAAEIAADIDALGAAANNAPADQAARDGAVSSAMAGGYPSEAGEMKTSQGASQQNGEDQANTFLLLKSCARSRGRVRCACNLKTSLSPLMANRSKAI